MRASHGPVGRLLALCATLIVLGGCALPPAVAIASYVLDIGSFVATGKTATDHGISALAQQDCAIMRVLEGQLCRDDPDYQTADAGVLQPLEPAGPQAILPPSLQPQAASRATGLQVASSAPVTSFAPPTSYATATGAPTPISPLAAGGDLGRLPAIELLPDARFLSDDVWLAGHTVTRDGLLGGAAYLADGLGRASAGNGG
jgi:hypothetical protein